MRDVVRNAGVCGGVIALAGGAVLVTSSIVGLVHERDHLRDQVGALSRRTAQPVVSPTAGPAPASPAPTNRPGAPPGAVVVQRVIRVTHQQPVPSPSSPHPSPSPSPSPPPAPSPAACPVAQVVTVRLPVGVLPCGTVQVAHIATIGGTGGSR